MRGNFILVLTTESKSQIVRMQSEKCGTAKVKLVGVAWLTDLAHSPTRSAVGLAVAPHGGS